MAFPVPKGEFSMFFRGWNRLECRSRRDDFDFGLKTPVADPLWLLGRQEQSGEYFGGDAATPTDVQVSYEVFPLDRIKVGEGSAEPLGDIPVEVLVEREAVDWDWRMRVRVGQQFERIARLHNAQPLIDYVRGFCLIDQPPQDSDDWLQTDMTSRRFVKFVAGRAIDGQRLRETINAIRSAMPSASAVLDAFETWFARLYSQGPTRWSPAWNAEDLDYSFQIQSSDPTRPGPLRAGRYRNGELDWDTFQIAGRGAESPSNAKVVHLTPAHATFAGMPARRWWEFEDSAVNFGAVDVARTDVAKLMLVNFALVFGDDWFVVPLTAQPNCLIRIREVCVRDCFGLDTSIHRAREAASNPLAQWDVFTLSSSDGDDVGGDFLYVPPATGSREESAALELIRLARDEGANMVFAIEHVVPNGLGEPMGGHEAHLEAFRRLRAQTSSAQTEEETSSAGLSAAGLKYRLATKVPRNWIPFVPLASENTVNGLPRRSVRLRRAEIISAESTSDQLIRISAHSRLLDPKEGVAVESIREEAVGRSGLRVELRRQRVRSATGETYVWLGRKIAMGRGEARSGLRFDDAKSVLTAAV